jgi:hypothetical protein
MSSNVFTPGPTPQTVRSADGKVLMAPEGWTLLPPGDAALTRRVKAAGEHWVAQEKKGRKVFSRGVWAPATTIERIRIELKAERSTEGYAKRKQADSRRRDKAHVEYVEDFHAAVVTFLAFHPVHADLGNRLARAVADHATPVGSGTVARTKRIPIEQRAQAAVIAWLRHQTTALGVDDIIRQCACRHFAAQFLVSIIQTTVLEAPQRCDMEQLGIRHPPTQQPSKPLRFPNVGESDPDLGQLFCGRCGLILFHDFVHARKAYSSFTTFTNNDRSPNLSMSCSSAARQSSYTAWAEWGLLH